MTSFPYYHSQRVDVVRMQRTCVFVYLSTVTPAMLHRVLSLYLPFLTYMLAWLHKYMHTYMHAYIHTYMDAYIYTYIHIYVHTHTHTRTFQSRHLHSLTTALLVREFLTVVRYAEDDMWKTFPKKLPICMIVQLRAEQKCDSFSAILFWSYWFSIAIFAALCTRSTEPAVRNLRNEDFLWCPIR